MTNGPRMVELDVLRGYAVAVMILVVSPGSWAHSFPQLQHAAWHGWTFADFVFPDFLFGVGMALGLTFGRSLDPRDPRAFWLKLCRRVLGLILLGLALNYLAVVAGHLGAPPTGPDDHTTWRIPGVLQRIAGAYLIAVLVLLATSRRAAGVPMQPNPPAILAALAVLLIGYWGLLTFVPVPGFGAGDLGMAGNLPAYVDRTVFGTEHMWPLGAASWRGPILYDPEGLLATLPASGNILFGILAICIWRRPERARIAALAIIGLGLVATGLLLDPIFPINKKIWTSSFVLLTSGLSFLALLVAAALLRARLTPLWPLKVLGGNAILAFSISIALSALSAIPLTFGGVTATLQERGFAIVSRLIPEPYAASLACAFGVVAFIMLLVWPLHRKGIHLRL
ncbi:MAG: heparan-alpha-glucosaminide N-acetyltransferase domain-containing protein [Sphingomonas sp.]